MIGIAAGIVSNLVMGKISQKIGKPFELPKTEIPKPTPVNLMQFKARSGRRGHGFYSPQPKPAEVETVGTSASTQYNAILRRMLNLQKYT